MDWNSIVNYANDNPVFVIGAALALVAVALFVYVYYKLIKPIEVVHENVITPKLVNVPAGGRAEVLKRQISYLTNEIEAKRRDYLAVSKTYTESLNEANYLRDTIKMLEQELYKLEFEYAQLNGGRKQ